MTDEHSYRELLSHDHRRLDALFSDVLVRLGRDDREETAAAWNDFSVGLLAHLELEEREILPAFAAAHAEEARAILDEHAAFRAKLSDLDVAVDLHFIREDVARDFTEALRAHARREDALMYAWADEHLQRSVNVTAAMR